MTVWQMPSTKLISIHGKFKFGLKKLSVKVKRLQFSICQLYLVPIKEGKESKVIELFTSDAYHCEFLEYWNTQKSVWRIWKHFSCLLDEGIPKIWQKLNSHGGFLRADQGRAKNYCHVGWISCPILQVAQKVDMKNIFKDFLLYFTTLER